MVMEATYRVSAKRKEPRFTRLWHGLCRSLGWESRSCISKQGGLGTVHGVPTIAQLCSNVICKQTTSVSIQRTRYTHLSLHHAGLYYQSTISVERPCGATWAIISATRLFWQHRRDDNCALWQRAPHSFCLFLVHRTSLYHHAGTLYR